MKKEWFHSLDSAITVCDKDGKIVYMNRKSVEAFKKEGGKKLIGSNLMDCHPEEARRKLEDMIRNQEEHIYTIEKNGIKKMIIQKPVYSHGNFDGFIEMSLIIPGDMPHFKRD